jgi:transposase-like protein
MARRQARRGNGRFTGNTMENTFGLHCDVCPHEDCRRLNPSRVDEPRPHTCHACGRPLQSEGKSEENTNG